ncbi:MAG TPA: hypothetical protein VED85_00855 [Burkholderiaceae bacterium]|nr:hypothetical protein [Burkholderiaceae bacterium]
MAVPLLAAAATFASAQAASVVVLRAKAANESCVAETTLLDPSIP